MVGRRIGLSGRNRNHLLHRFIVQHKLQCASIRQLKSSTGPETGARAGGIEIVGDSVIGIIQHKGIAITAQQAADAGEKLIGLAISTGKVGKLQLRAAQQGEGRVIQAGGGSAAGVIDAQLTIAQRKAGIQNRAGHAQRQLTPGADDNRGANRKRTLLQINMTGKRIRKAADRGTTRPGLEQQTAAADLVGIVDGSICRGIEFENSPAVHSNRRGNQCSPAGEGESTLCHGGGLGVGIVTTQAQFTHPGLGQPGGYTCRNTSFAIQWSFAGSNENAAADIETGIFCHADGCSILAQGQIGAGNGRNGRILSRGIRCRPGRDRGISISAAAVAQIQIGIGYARDTTPHQVDSKPCSCLIIAPSAYAYTDMQPATLEHVY